MRFELGKIYKQTWSNGGGLWVKPIHKQVNGRWTVICYDPEIHKTKPRIHQGVDETLYFWELSDTTPEPLKATL
jgi:hypothetical protein